MGSLLRRLIEIFGLLAFATVASAQVGTFGPTGQQAVTATATAVKIPAGLAVVCIEGAATNSVPAVVFIGNASVTTSTGYGLSAGQPTCVPVQGQALVIYVIATGTGSSVQWFGTVQ